MSENPLDLSKPLEAALYIMSFTGKDVSLESLYECQLGARQLLAETPTEEEFTEVYGVLIARLQLELEQNLIDQARFDAESADVRTSLETINKHFGTAYILPA